MPNLLCLRQLNKKAVLSMKAQIMKAKGEKLMRSTPASPRHFWSWRCTRTSRLR
jgi:hypothetical protein